MNEEDAMLTEGRLFVLEGEGKNDRLSKTTAEVQHLTLMLSPSQGEKREKAGILRLQ